jgi:hypothetical protein
MENEPVELEDHKEDVLADELGKYEGKWVAILESEQKVVGSGNDAYEAKVDAERNGYTDTALFRVPERGKYYVYSL